MSKLFNLSNHRVSRALYCLFILFFFNRGSKAWWSEKSWTCFPYRWNLKRCRPQTTASNSSSRTECFFLHRSGICCQKQLVLVRRCFVAAEKLFPSQCYMRQSWRCCVCFRCSVLDTVVLLVISLGFRSRRFLLPSIPSFFPFFQKLPQIVGFFG